MGSSDRIRRLAEGDLPAVADLHMRAFRDAAAPAPPGMAEEFGAVFLGHPWERHGLSSLVCDGRDGRPVAFLGVLPRPMRFLGRPILASVTTQLMVDPERGDPTTALRLCRAYFEGPQELSIADEGSERSRRLWQSLGGATSRLFSMRWTKILSASRFLLRGRETAGPPAVLRRLLSLAAAPLDPLLRRAGQPFRIGGSSLLGAPLEPARFLECLELSAKGAALLPEYDERTVSWLFEMARHKRCHGALRSNLLLDGTRPAGAYLYYARRGGTAQVLCLHAGEERFTDALHHLFADARAAGAIAVSGRLDPRRLAEFSDAGCLLNRSYNWMQVRSRDKDLLLAIQAGDALLTRLEGEWWVAVNLEDFTQPAGAA